MDQQANLKKVFQYDESWDPAKITYFCYRCQLYKVVDVIQLKIINESKDTMQILEYVLRLTGGGILTVLGYYILFNSSFRDHPYPVMGISCVAMASRLLLMQSIQIFLIFFSAKELNYILLADPADYLHDYSQEE